MEQDLGGTSSWQSKTSDCQALQQNVFFLHTNSESITSGKLATIDEPSILAIMIDWIEILIFMATWTCASDSFLRLRFVSTGPTRTLLLWPWRVFQIVIIIIIIS